MFPSSWFLFFLQVSSDEDIGIFQRSLVTPVFGSEEKELDESLTSNTWSQIKDLVPEEEDDTENIPLMPNDDIVSKARLQSTHSSPSNVTKDRPSTAPAGTSLSDRNHGVSKPVNTVESIDDSETIHPPGATNNQPPITPKLQGWMGATGTSNNKNDTIAQRKHLRSLDESSPVQRDNRKDGRRPRQKKSVRETKSEEVVSMFLPSQAPSLLNKLDAFDLGKDLAIVIM